jgi:hypothetical protein
MNDDGLNERKYSMTIHPLFRVAFTLDLMLAIFEEANLPFPIVLPIAGNHMVQLAALAGLTYCILEISDVISELRQRKAKEVTRTD